MTVANAIAELRGIGYIVGLESGNKVKLSWQGQGRPNKNRVLPLLEHLKAHKKEALDLLFSECLHRVLDIFEGKFMGVHKQDYKDLNCPGCCPPQKVEQGRLF